MDKQTRYQIEVMGEDSKWHLVMDGDKPYCVFTQQAAFSEANISANCDGRQTRVLQIDVTELCIFMPSKGLK